MTAVVSAWCSPAAVVGLSAWERRGKHLLASDGGATAQPLPRIIDITLYTARTCCPVSFAAIPSIHHSHAETIIATRISSPRQTGRHRP